MENKKSKTVIIIISVIAALAVVAAVMVIATSKGRTLKKQLNLGQKYLSEMNYEEAIAVFEKALEIDPMSEEAYVGIADAYIAMASEKTEEQDYEGALSLLNEAKNTLEKGIKILNGVGGDTSLLESKLSEVGEEITRTEEEKKSAEEEMRLAAMPYIELQPILDACSNVWGRNWDEWTPDDFRQALNIQTFTRSNGSQYEADREENYTYLLSIYETNTNLQEYNYTVHKRDDYFTLTLGAACKSIIIHYGEDAYYSFEQYIVPGYHGNYIDGNFYDYALDNGITDADSFISFLGLEDISGVGDTIDIRTDYGEATLTRAPKSVKISLNDGRTNSTFSTISVYECGYGDGGIKMEIGKYIQ